MSKTLLAAAALLASALPVHAATPRLTRPEVQMIATVDAEQPRTLALLERLVNQNSGSTNLAGVEAVGTMIRAELEPLGFAVRWIPMRETGRAGHLVAHHPGRGKKLLLIGHLDTVFELDSPFQRWTRDGAVAHGPGASDDKGGDVVIIAALRAMKAAGTLDAADITVFLTGDEEDTGSPLAIARRDLVAAGKTADVALDFEGLVTGDHGEDMGSVSRRGAMSWSVTVKARPGHSSGIFSAKSGYGAGYEVARIADSFRRELTDDKLTYNIGLIAAGTTATLDPERIRAAVTGKTNIIDAEGVIRGDLRALTVEQVARTQARMRAIVATPLNGATSIITFDDDGYPPMSPTPGNFALLDRLNAVNASLGLPAMAPLDPLRRGAGDISFVAADVDSLAGLGPASTGDHTPAETVNIASIWRQAKRAAILMSRLGADKRQAAAGDRPMP